MNKTIFMMCIVVAVGLALSCSKTEEEVVARLGDDVITAGMVKDEYLAISAGSRPVLATIEEQEQFVRDILSKEIMEREAVKLGLDVLPEVQQARQSMIQRKAWELYYNDKVRSRVGVSEQEIEDLYELQRYRYHLGWIFVRSRALIEELAGRIAAWGPGSARRRLCGGTSGRRHSRSECSLGSQGRGLRPRCARRPAIRADRHRADGWNNRCVGRGDLLRLGSEIHSAGARCRRTYAHRSNSPRADRTLSSR